MDGINARHTTTNRDPGDGTDITTTWKLTTSQQQQQQQQQGVSCRHSGRSGKHVEGSVQAQFSISIFLPSARVLRSRAGDSIISKNQKS